MTHEELLAGYLDNSLTESEKAEFEGLLKTSPEFARDAQELLKIEEFLKEGTAITSPIPEDFLAGVENRVAGRIHHERYHAEGPNVFNKILSALWIVPIILILGTGAYFLLRSPEKQPAKEQEVVLKDNGNSTVRAPEQQVQPEAPASVRQPGSAPEQQMPVESEPQGTIRTPAEMQVNVERQKSDSEEKALENTRQKLSQARAEGKKATEAALLKQMGMLAFKTGNISEAKNYLHEAIALSHSLRLTQLEAETSGELGIVLKREGNLTDAKEYFTKAIELLKASGQNAERWEKEIMP